MRTKYFLAMTAVMMMLCVGAIAQKKQPAGMRVEVADAETEKGDYSVFTYVDDNGDFGYYLSLGRVTDFLIADEILGIDVNGIKNIKETTIYLGAHYDEAYAALDNIMALYDKDLETTVEFQGRTVTGGERLGDASTTQCIVAKKPLGGKRLKFVFTQGKNQAHAYLTKQTLKELRMGLKISKKINPKLHR
jgi:hypothetical protein